jgi:hypothetical protein
MTFTVTETQMYTAVLLLLMILQVYQYRLIKKLEKDNSDIWAQLGTLVANLTTQMLQMQKDINSKQDKTSGSEANRNTK